MTYYVLEEVLEEQQDRKSKLSFNEYGHDDVIVQAWAAWLRQKPSLDPKKKGAVHNLCARTTVRVKLTFICGTLYHLCFTPLLVKNKSTKPETPSVPLRHCDELCETKTVTWYSVRTSTKTILLRLAWV
jgi:hypothetical protein